MAELSVTASLRTLIASLLNQLLYFQDSKAHIKSLRNELMNLQNRKAEIVSKVDIANSLGQVIPQGVNDWLEEANRVKEEADLLLGSLTNSQMGCYSSFRRSGLKLRNSIGKKVKMTASKISTLLEAVHIFHAPPPPEVSNMESRMSIETQIIEFLFDESISMIGVCGLVGVGKTTAIQAISRDVRVMNTFDKVVGVAVSQIPNVIGIQDQLASILELPLVERSVVERAERLNMRLMDKQSRILVILEDIWEELDLSTIGVRGDYPKGLKVILTSRQLNVCRKMGVQKIVQVEPLSETEAWSLFEQIAEINQDAPEGITEIAKTMVYKSYGLPLLICAFGSQFRGHKEGDAWSSRDQDKLDKFGPEQLVTKQIQLSYNYLHLEFKAVLLICSLFPEDYEIWIEDLARYVKGLHMFKSIHTLLQTREKLESIINMLIDFFLLLKCGNDRVKLHGIVRNYCLSIVSSHKDVTTTSHEKLRKCIPNSLCIAEPAQIFSQQSQTSELQLLRLVFHGQRSSTSTRDFLQGMEKLEVLDIQSIGLELSKVSLNFLVSVRTLSLNDCRLENDLSGISSLKNIEILSFYGSTYVGEFPNEIGELIHLKSLDLRFLKGRPDPLPSGILKKFRKLEELYLGSLLPEDINAEIRSLSQLNTIQASVVAWRL